MQLVQNYGLRWVKEVHVVHFIHDEASLACRSCFAVGRPRLGLVDFLASSVYFAAAACKFRNQTENYISKVEFWEVRKQIQELKTIKRSHSPLHASSSSREQHMLATLHGTEFSRCSWILLDFMHCILKRSELNCCIILYYTIQYTYKYSLNIFSQL